jgi:hypothetical protein
VRRDDRPRPDAATSVHAPSAASASRTRTRPSQPWPP